ncbi:MAG: hypothetical protein JSW26_22845 [Desulfobacterales bacterium]|nr:MAG: hypothetical protein JSW26_22845 [Desulfobacterales bacterium]
MSLILKHIIQHPTFLPTTTREVHFLRWQQLEVILVTGDTYIESPHIGVAVIGRVLLYAGCRRSSRIPWSIAHPAR